MANPRDVKKLRQLLEVRGVIRLQAEFRVGLAGERLRSFQSARETADGALVQAEADWRAGVVTSAFRPEWLGNLGARVVDRDRQLTDAQTQLDAASEDHRNHEAAQRLADASERVARDVLSRARNAAAKRREERRIADRPSRFPEGTRS